MAVASASGKWRFGLVTDAAQLRSSRGAADPREAGRKGWAKAWVIGKAEFGCL